MVSCTTYITGSYISLVHTNTATSTVLTFFPESTRFRPSGEKFLSFEGKRTKLQGVCFAYCCSNGFWMASTIPIMEMYLLWYPRLLPFSRAT